MTTHEGKSAHHLSLAHQLTIAGFVMLLSFGSIIAWYGYTQLTSLSTQVAALDAKFDAQIASTTAYLQSNIADATSTFRTALTEETRGVQAQIGSITNQVGSLSGTLTNLQKLSQTDPELLAKYSRVFFLSDAYAPARLAPVPQPYVYSETKQLQLIPEVLPYVVRMLEQAKADGVPLYIYSAYRSFASQKSLKSQYTVTYGTGTANQFSADQGYSEHQLGTTIDFITTGTGGALAGFDNTPAYTWMLAHAHQYGFILSYPKDNGYYIFEPWHWRFVGVKLATDLHEKQSHFYTLDQRTIDTYLSTLFD